MNTKHFGLRGCYEHRRMKWGDVQLLTDVDGAEYLEFSERQTKTRTGAEPRNVRAVKPKAYSFANGSPDRDPVFVYKTLLAYQFWICFFRYFQTSSSIFN